MTESTFYRLSDRAIELLDKRLARRAQKARQAMLIEGFDELNVISTMKELYAGLFADNEEVYADLVGLVYAKAGGKGKAPDKEWLRRHILEAPDPVTLYIYLYEEERKRDRTTEAINSSIGQPAKQKAFARGLRYWHDMTREYSDQITYQTTIEAYRSRGVQRVMWLTAEDERVCGECAPRDRRIYLVSEVPPRPHWNCRCEIVPV